MFKLETSLSSVNSTSFNSMVHLVDHGPSPLFCQSRCFSLSCLFNQNIPLHDLNLSNLDPLRHRSTPTSRSPAHASPGEFRPSHMPQQSRTSPAPTHVQCIPGTQTCHVPGLNGASPPSSSLLSSDATTAATPNRWKEATWVLAGTAECLHDPLTASTTLVENRSATPDQRSAQPALSLAA